MDKRSPLLGHSQLSYYVPMVQFRSSKIILFNQYQGNTKSAKMMDVNLKENFKDAKTYSGTITKQSRQRLEFSLDMLWQMTNTRYLKKWNGGELKTIKQHLTFVTLTIPDQITRINGKDGYSKLLDPFIQWLKRRKGVKSYVWKAELQQPTDFFGNVKLCNGQLHYHLILPNYLDKGEVRAKWNYLLYINGLMNDYINKHGNENPPSTWVGSCRKAKSANYLLKEITKNIVSSQDIKKKTERLEKELTDNGRTEIAYNLIQDIKAMRKKIAKEADTIGGKVWGCSENLQPKKIKDKDGFITTKKYFTTELTTELEKALHDFDLSCRLTEDWQIRSFIDGQNDLVFYKDDNDEMQIAPPMGSRDGIGHLYTKNKQGYYSLYKGGQRFEILTMPNSYQDKLLNYKIFDGYDKDFKPIYKKGLEEYARHLSYFNNEKIIETTKRKYIKLSSVMVDSKGEFVYKKKKSFEKSILQPC